MEALCIRYVVLWISIFTILCVFDVAEVNASYIKGINEDRNKYLRVLTLEPESNFFLVGAKNTLYRINSLTLEVIAAHSWNASSASIQNCRAYPNVFKGDCDSYVRTAVKINDTYYQICASSAGTPACRPYVNTQNGDWVLGDELVSYSSQGYAPTNPWLNILLLKTQEGITYSLTTTWQGGVMDSILYRDSFTYKDGTQVGALISPFLPEFINRDEKLGMEPHYAGMFETDSHIYFAYTESAIETFGFQPTSYSRLARVCKNDKGHRSVKNKFQFLTFFKARLLCGFPEKPKASPNDMDLTYAFYFDEIASATEPQVSSLVPDEKVIIAVFNSPVVSLGGSAICAYKMSDIDRLFDQSQQLTHEQSSTGGYNWQAKRYTDTPPARCPEDTSTLTGDKLDNWKYPFLSNPIRSILNTTIFVQTGYDYRITQMVVDWQVKGLDGKAYDIIFLATDDGRLLKLVHFKKSENEQPRYHIVEERHVFHNRSAVMEMKFSAEISRVKHLLLNSLHDLKQVTLEKCHNYLTCGECIATHDPYCGWSPSLNKCVSKSHDVDDKFQNMLGTDDRCVVSTVPLPETTTAANDTDLLPKHDVVQSKPSVTKASTNTESILIAMLVVLSLMSLAGGFYGGMYFQKRKHRKENLTPHLDKRISDKSIHKSDIDPYDVPPKSNNSIPVIKNNIHAKQINSHSDVNINDGTLQKAKKSYV